MKNVKLNKKLLSMITAITLMTTPVMGSTEENTNKDTNENEFSLILQEKDYTTLSMADYYEGVRSSYEYLTKYINYDNMQADLQCLYYLINREYMYDDVEERLIDSSMVYETNFTEQKYENFMRAYNLINVIADYNQSTIRKTDSISELIDVSMLCYSDSDRKLVHNMHENYFNAYKNGRFYNEDYNMVFKQLTTLNAYEQAGNASELSVGARWNALTSIGGGVMQMLRDDQQEDFTREELNQYYDENELNKGQWILRNDISLDLNCLKNELEFEVFNFGQLWSFVYDHVNDDLMKSFEIDCSKTK